MYMLKSVLHIVVSMNSTVELQRQRKMVLGKHLLSLLCRMKAWTENHFKEIFASIDVNDEEVFLNSVIEQVVKNMFRVWDHDKDGFVNIRDFIHTYAYAQLVYFTDSLLNRDLKTIDQTTSLNQLILQEIV